MLRIKNIALTLVTLLCLCLFACTPPASATFGMNMGMGRIPMFELGASTRTMGESTPVESMSWDPNAKTYTPITPESMTQLVEYTITTFYSEEFPDHKWGDRFQVLVVDPNTNHPGTWAALGLEAMEPYVWMAGIAWPVEYGRGDPDWVIPQCVLEDHNIPITLIFNTYYCDTMNDLTLVGLVTHDFRHIYDWTCDYSTDVSLMSTQGYVFREPAIDSMTVAAKDLLGATVPLYEWLLWGELHFPPLAPGVPQAASYTPDDLKMFYSRNFLYLEILMPGIPWEVFIAMGWIDQVSYDTYLYLQSH